MDRLQRILVGIDFSRCSLNALEHGVRMARWNGAQLHLMHIESPLEVLPAGADRLEQLAEIEGVDVEVHLARGLQLETIQKEVAGIRPDLLVVGAYGPLGAYLGTGIGSFTAHCLRHVPVKTLVVRERRVPAFSKIVACLDLSSTTEAVLEQAVRVARQERGRLDLLHVVRTGEDLTAPREKLAVLNAELADQTSFEIRTRLLERASYASGVLEHSGATGADLVVLGAGARSDLGYALLGTTAERVLREIRCSTLVAKTRHTDPAPSTAASAEAAKRFETTGLFERLTASP